MTLGIGQRSDVVVEANGKEDAYWMRSDISKVTPLNEQPRALAAIYYGRTDTMTTPKSKATVYDDTQLANDPLTLTTPVYSLAPPKIADKTFTFDITLGVNATNHTLWFMNGSSFRANYNNPLLLLAKMGNTSYPESPQWNVYNSGDARSVRVIVRSFRETSHPMVSHITPSKHTQTPYSQSSRF